MIQLKANCNKLHEQVALYTALTRPFSSCEKRTKKHGRTEHRWVGIYENRIKVPKGWNDIQRIIKVRRWGTRSGKPYDFTAYYILSKPMNNASSIARMIRGHWKIENALHWTKDVLMGEDNMTITEQRSAGLVGMLNTLALNLLRLAGFKPNKDTLLRFTNNVKELHKLLAF